MASGLRLLDVNVLVPLLWPSHVHYPAAQAWFTAARDEGWATCPITQLGCLRVLATPAISQSALTAQSAARLLAESLLGDPYHHFWPDDLPLEDAEFVSSLAHVQGPRQLTDRYLLALAAARNGTLATFDGALAASLPASSPLLAHLEVLEA